MTGANGQQWLLLILVDIVSRLMFIHGNTAVLFSADATLGRILSLCGFSIFLVSYVPRLCIKFPSAATKRQEFVASNFEAFGSVSFAIAKHLIQNGNMSFVWLYITGNVLYLFGGLLNAVNYYDLQQMERLQNARKAREESQSRN